MKKPQKKVVEIAHKSGMIVSPLNGETDPKKIDDATNLLVGIMNVGAEEFQEKIGRPMTYGEMRQMYG